MRKEWLRNEIAVIGLARSGRAVATLLARGGADVYASDVGRSPEIEATAAALRAEGVVVDVGVHDQARIVSASLVVVSPGVPPTAPPLVVARKGYYTDLAKWAAGKGHAELRVDGERLPTARWPRLVRCSIATVGGIP